MAERSGWPGDQENNQKGNGGRTVPSSSAMWEFGHFLWAIWSSWKAMWWGMMCPNVLEGSLWLLHWDRECMIHGHHCPSCSHSPNEGEEPTPWLCKCLDCHGILGSPSGLGAPAHTASVGMLTLLRISWRRSAPMLWKWDGMVCPHPPWIQRLALPQKQTDLSAGSSLDHSSLYTKVYFVLKLLGFWSVFQTDSAEMETSSFLF